ncbi:XdhC/CoxI family protein [Niallia oryzisoli]|uniref:XdhC/CoxI family protein n=1 Tax=Niallia oryzisoli TaxID=1737571 RepID=A0ABZ2C7P6_9BACI
MDNIHQILQVAPSENDVLTTVIDVEGSAYRKEGTTMLIQEQGKLVGMLSGGCLEEDVRLRAEGLKKGQSQSFFYNMKSENDLDWGQGAGCNGGIRVLLEKIDAPSRLYLQKMHERLLKGKSVLTVKKLSSEYSVSESVFIVDEDNYWGNGENHFVKEVLLLMKNVDSAASGIHYIEELSCHCFFHWFHPKPRLLIVGAGPDAIPLSYFASRTGFSVTITDWRPALCNKETFPHADVLLTGFPTEIFPGFEFHPHDFVILMTHHFQRDKEALHYLLGKPLQYIGIIGSKERTSRLMGGKELPQNVYSPVGLAIGAEGPEEIAISVMAELIQLNRTIVKTKREAVI